MNENKTDYIHNIKQQIIKLKTEIKDSNKKLLTFTIVVGIVWTIGTLLLFT